MSCAASSSPSKTGEGFRGRLVSIEKLCAGVQAGRLTGSRVQVTPELRFEWQEGNNHMVAHGQLDDDLKALMDKTGIQVHWTVNDLAS